MRKLGLVIIGMIVWSVVYPVVLGQEDVKPVILLYHGPKKGDQELSVYGEALAELIEQDSRLQGEAEIVLVGDQDLMNTLLYFPQVKCVILALTTWELEAQRLVPSLEWYFNQGGSIVGLGNAGKGDVTFRLNGSIFPLFGTQYYTVNPTFVCVNKETGEERIVEIPRCNDNEVRQLVRQTTYVQSTDHEITQGVADEFTLKDSRFVAHLNTSTKEFTHMVPEEGDYTMVYQDNDLGAPLVVVYEDNGTTVTFAGTDQMSVHEGDPAYYGNILEDENFVKLFQNSVYYAWNEETKYEDAMARAQQKFEEMEQEEEALKEQVEKSQSQETTSSLMRSVLLIVVGLVLIAIIAYFCFIVPSRERGAEVEEVAEEEGQ